MMSIHQIHVFERPIGRNLQCMVLMRTLTLISVLLVQCSRCLSSTFKGVHRHLRDQGSIPGQDFLATTYGSFTNSEDHTLKIPY